MEEEIINLNTLPSLPLSDKHKLPNCSAVYIVHDNGQWLYVGSTKSLTRRWLQHNQCAALSAYSSPVISWQETPEYNLREVESSIIERYQPLLNRQWLSGFNTVILRSIGGALMVTIPQKIVRQEGLQAGDEVRIAVMVGHVITVKPQRAKGRSK